jgi:hypothetical protein
VSRDAIDRCDETITPTGNVGYIPGAIRDIAQNLAQTGDVDAEVALLHREIRPGALHQVAVADDVSRTLDESDEDVESASAHRDRLALLKE